MSLPDILLSLLREPMSGSDLIRVFRSTIRHFWQTDLSQIYRALDALQNDGCLESSTVPSSRGPARKVYRLTEKGDRRLRDWIRRPPRSPALKLEYLAQLFSAPADEKPRERAREMLLSMRAEAVRAVAILERIDAEAAKDPGYPDALPSNVFYPWLTVRHGLLRRRALLDWLDESVARLERRDESLDRSPSTESLSELLGQVGSFEAETGESEER